MIKIAQAALVGGLLIWSASLCAQEAPARPSGVPKEPFKVFDTKSKAPVEITSLKLSADLAENKIFFIGQVVVRQGSRVIYSDNLEATYDEEGGIKSFYATGNVKMTSKESFAVGDKMFWDNTKQTVKLWGNPRLIRDKQVILGEEMLFYTNEDRLDISKPQIEWLPERKGSKGSEADERE
jgi:lipopolysaccharide transport protein LptA